VDALSGCAKWSLDLLSWLTDCLFALLDDTAFISLLNPHRFAEVTPFLQQRNDVSLHLLLCSSTRGFLSAVCRRLLHLEALSNRAIEFYERKAAMQNAADAGQQTKIPHIVLYKAYQKMQRITSTSLVKVQAFDKLLSTLGADIRQAYQVSLTSLASKSAAAAAAQAGGNAANTGKQMDQVIKNAQSHCELNMLLAASPPAAFLPVIAKFFNNDLKFYRVHADPARLFFADFDLLEVEDDKRSLVAKKSKGRYVDVFKRIELIAPKVSAASTGNKRKIANGEGEKNVPATGPNGASSTSPQWRRCVRCASVMEDVFGHRPGFTFVLTQQRKCACGGHWALLPRGTLIL
jgi:mediator of RNA polymerase II transcription subunit 16, fungi type